MSTTTTAKSKSSLTETPNKKTSPGTPRVVKLNKGVAKPDGNSPSPLQNGKLNKGVVKPDANSPSSLQRPHSSIGSPQSVSSKLSVDRRSPRPATPSGKTQPRVTKGSDLQSQLSLLQEDLKKAKEQIGLIEIVKVRALDELKEAQRKAEEANEKLREALVAQKRAEESSEIEKFRAVELEQVGIEAAQKKEEEWQKEIEAVRNQHALDSASLMTTTQELQRVKQELAAFIDAKNQAMNHADDATKIAEIHAEKMEALSAEFTRMKDLLESKLETESKENNKLVLELKSEIDSLKQELEKVKVLEERLKEKEASVEQLNVDLEAARMAESYSHSLAEEWKRQVEELKLNAEEAKNLERYASESLESVMKQLEESNNLLHNAESEIDALKEKVGLLEMTVERQKEDLQESEHHVEMVKLEKSDMNKVAKSLKTELERVEEEKVQALNNEKLAASNVLSLLEEKNKLKDEIEKSKYEEEKSKNAMESLASALHEVSAAAREAKERLLSLEAELGSYESQIEDLKSVLEATNEKYETSLDEAKHKIVILSNTIEQFKCDYEKSRNEREEKERRMANCLKQSEEEKSSMGKELDRLVSLLKQREEEIATTKAEGAQLKDSLKSVLIATNKKYETSLDEAKHKIVILSNTIEQSKCDYEKSRNECEEKERKMVNCLKQSEEEKSSMGKELDTLVSLLKQREEEIATTKAEGAQLKDSLQEVESEVICLQENISAKNAESIKLKESLLDKENELQTVINENEELWSRESVALKKAEELSRMLEEALTQKPSEENGILSDCEKDYDMLPKVVEYTEENGHAIQDKSQMDNSPQHCDEPKTENTCEADNPLSNDTVQSSSQKAGHMDGNPKDEESKEKEDNSIELELNMLEGSKIEKKELSLGRELEDSVEEEMEKKSEGHENVSQVNALPSAENNEDGKIPPSKKKKPLLSKIGSLLRKKGTNQK